MLKKLWLSIFRKYFETFQEKDARWAKEAREDKINKTKEPS